MQKRQCLHHRSRHLTAWRGRLCGLPQLDRLGQRRLVQDLERIAPISERGDPYLQPGQQPLEFEHDNLRSQAPFAVECLEVT
jgi:hypothetical protein